MTVQDANKILHHSDWNEIYPDKSCVDGWFTAEELEAIAFLMRDKQAKADALTATPPPSLAATLPASPPTTPP